MGPNVWLAITPYPYGNAKYENPSLFRSGDGLTWQLPEGIVNPIASPKTGSLSDPAPPLPQGDLPPPEPEDMPTGTVAN